MTLLSVAFCALLAILSVNAQSQPYGQCGGIGWTGSTTCTSGWTCVASNAYYSQCLQGVATTTATTKGTTTTTSAPSSTASPSKINYWFAFGDSYTATGFNINSTKPSTSNPLGNPSTPTNAGGGASYVDYLTTTYNTSQLLTYNFAYNGATVDKSIVTPIQGVTMTDEVNSFMNTVASKPSYAPWTSTDALFSFWIGINDIGSTFNNGNSSSVNAELISAYFGLVQKLYNAGARNFMFINVPAIDRSPQYIGEGTAAAAKIKADVADYNSKLSSAISSFKSANTAANTFLWDSNAEFNTILNNPKSYGFTDATSQGSASGDFWGNVLHPGPAAHKLFAQNIATAVLSGTVW